MDTNQNKLYRTDDITFEKLKNYNSYSMTLGKLKENKLYRTDDMTFKKYKKKSHKMNNVIIKKYNDTFEEDVKNCKIIDVQPVTIIEIDGEYKILGI